MSHLPLQEAVMSEAHRMAAGERVAADIMCSLLEIFVSSSFQPLSCVSDYTICRSSSLVQSMVLQLKSLV